MFEPNTTSHQDLVLRAGSFVRRSDSYYYALDQGVGKASSVEESIRLMLAQWTSSIEASGVGDVVFLPYGFFDQSTAWLRCEAVSRDEFEVVAGWSAVEGYTFSPSDYGAVAEGMNDFEGLKEFSLLRMTRAQLLADIDASVAALV